MTLQLKKLWTDTDGVLAFEWTLMLTVLVIGIVSGATAARDAIIDELGDTAQVMLAVDQSYTIAFPLYTAMHTNDVSSASDTGFTDAAIYADCTRTASLDPLAANPIAGQNVDPVNGLPGDPTTINDGTWPAP